MHELGVVFYIIKDVKDAAAANNVEKIHSVTLQVGEVSGIVNDYLEDCWDWAKKKEGPLLSDAKLLFETITAITYCEDCKKEYETLAYGKICPHCGSPHTYLKVGSDCAVKQIEAS